MNNKLEINIDNIKIEIDVKEEEKDLYNEIIDEFNTEYNNVMIQYGNINKTIVLFYLLLKVENLFHTQSLDKDGLFLSLIKKTAKYITEKNNNKIDLEDQILQNRKNLLLVNLITRLKLKKDKKEISNIEDNEYLQLVEDLIDNIKGDINNTKNEIMLF